MFRSHDHLQGATLFLAKVTFFLSQSHAAYHTPHTHSQVHSQQRTTYIIRHAATAPS